MGTIPQLRKLIDQGITIGLQQFVNDYKPKMERDAQQSEEKYYNDYSSWADGYRLYDLKNIHTITGFAYSRSAELRARFDSSHMSGGHGIEILSWLDRYKIKVLLLIGLLLHLTFEEHRLRIKKHTKQ